MTKYYYAIIDRDGGELELSDEAYDTYEDADKAAEFWTDDWRYGSHEVYSEED